MMSITKFGAYAAIGLTCALSAPAHAADPSHPSMFLIGTADLTGVYYPAGSAICSLVNRGRYQHGYRCGIVRSSGSVENIERLNASDYGVALVQSDILAATDTGDTASLRALFGLHSEAVQVMTRGDANINSLADLRGKRVSIGEEESGTRTLGEKLLSASGVSQSSFAQTLAIPSAVQANELCSNRVDAVIWAAGAPNASTLDAARRCGAGVLSIDAATISKITSSDQSYAPITIEGGTYPGINEAIQTWGPKAILVVDASFDEDSAYLLVKTVFENLDELRTKNLALRNLDPQRMVNEGIAADFHPGAIRYYKERGWM